MSRLLTWHAGTDEDLFTTLMERYRNMVFRLASKYFKERQDCDDIVQETFLRVYKNMDSMDEKKISRHGFIESARTSAWTH